MQGNTASDAWVCYRDQYGAAYAHQFVSYGGGPFVCGRCGRGMPDAAPVALLPSMPCPFCASERATRAQAEAERDQARRERDAALAAMNADQADVVLAYATAESSLAAALRTRDDAQARADELLEAKRAAEAERDEARRDRDFFDAERQKVANREEGVLAAIARLRDRVRALEEALRSCVKALEAIAEDGEGCRSRYGPGCDGECERVARGPLEQARALLAPSGPGGEAPKEG